VFPPPDHLWYFLLDLLYEIQNVAALFPLELEQFFSSKAPHVVTSLSRGVGQHPFSLHNFLEILSGYGPKYNSHDVDSFSPSRECFFISNRATTDDALERTPSDLSPNNHAAYLKEKAEHF
jgi:hypothetical protein